MSLPNLFLYVGLHADPEWTVDSPTWDFNAWSDVRLVMTALGITKTKSVGAAELEITGGGKKLLAHITQANMTGKTANNYPYQIQVKGSDGEWRDAFGLPLGTAIVSAAA